MRLIDADKIQYAKDWVVTDKTPEVGGFNAKAIYRVTKEEIDAMPTVDAVPVVRCADCIRFRPDDDVWGWCTVDGKMRLKDYCSYGVRKDGERHEND